MLIIFSMFGFVHRPFLFIICSSMCYFLLHFPLNLHFRFFIFLTGGKGFTVFNLTGGIHVYSTQIDPSVPQY